MSRRRQTTVTGPLVVCAGGPLHGRWYRKGDWDTAIAAARAMGYPPGHPAAAALGYAETSPARHEPHPWLHVPDGVHADGHVHTWQHPTAPASETTPAGLTMAPAGPTTPTAARQATGRAAAADLTADDPPLAGRPDRPGGPGNSARRVDGCAAAGCATPGELPRCALCPRSPTYWRRPAPATPPPAPKATSAAPRVGAEVAGQEPRNRTPCDQRRGAA